MKWSLCNTSLIFWQGHATSYQNLGPTRPFTTDHTMLLNGWIILIFMLFAQFYYIWYFRPCDVFAHCTNNIGSYECNCFPGYEGDGHSCQGRKISIIANKRYLEDIWVIPVLRRDPNQIFKMNFITAGQCNCTKFRWSKNNSKTHR